MGPEHGRTAHDSYWDIKQSIANAIARSPKPSLFRLHNEVLEEFGYRPELELVDYFCTIAEISDKEIADYFRTIALPNGEQAGPQEKETGRAMADRIAAGPEPTILKFRAEHESRFGCAPPEDLLRYFLQKIEEVSAREAPVQVTREEREFAAEIAAEAGATVLRFLQRYRKKYGKEPPERLTRFFLLKKQQPAKPSPGPASQGQEPPRPPQDAEVEGQKDSRVIFARTVAKGLVTTILQFRKTYEKVYKEPPSSDLIEIFLKSLPRPDNNLG